MPPTLNIVIKLQLFSVANTAPFPPFSVGPISNVIASPLLSVNVVFGSYVIVTLLRWHSLSSKRAGFPGELFSAIILTVGARLTLQSIAMVRPDPLISKNRTKSSI